MKILLCRYIKHKQLHNQTARLILIHASKNGY
uniref:Uncharacterized protein n=1 Tax=Rhizophora mucronata TaxID=61149 RepID=A0A2P2NM52_RHIMU